MMKRILFVFLAIGFLFLFGQWGGGSQSMAYTGEGQKTLMLKSGNEGSGTEAMGVQSLRFAEEMKKRTNGKIQITHYISSQLGTARQMMESIKGGAMAYMVSGWGAWTPILDTTLLPYLFRDLDHTDKVINGPIGEEWKRALIQKTGIRIVGWVFRGYRNCTFTKTAVRTPADMKGLKLRVPESQVNLETWRAVGARPTPMAWAEVYTALQQGAIDGQENPTDTIMTNSLIEVQKYLVLTRHVNPPGWQQLSEKVWQSLTPETQKVWVDTWNEVAKEVRQRVVRDELAHFETWKSKGGVIIEPDEAAFRAAMKDVWKKFAPKAWGEGVYEKIQATR